MMVERPRRNCSAKLINGARSFHPESDQLSNIDSGLRNPAGGILNKVDRRNGTSSFLLTF